MHPLQLEATKVVTLAKMVRRRLWRWLEQNESLMPDRDWTELAKWYQKTISAMLVEHRAFTVLAKDRPPVSDEELRAEIAKLTADLVVAMPEEQFKALLQLRAGEQPSARPEMETDVDASVKAVSQSDGES